MPMRSRTTFTQCSSLLEQQDTLDDAPIWLHFHLLRKCSGIPRRSLPPVPGLPAFAKPRRLRSLGGTVGEMPVGRRTPLPTAVRRASRRDRRGPVETRATAVSLRQPRSHAAATAGHGATSQLRFLGENQGSPHPGCTPRRAEKGLRGVVLSIWRSCGERGATKAGHPTPPLPTYLASIDPDFAAQGGVDGSLVASKERAARADGPLLVDGSDGHRLTQ